ncbi:uncharacterized protein BX663DRAFT_507361 [Cokeromyces recurvatus]|uniref:uncharacterized protein n=1 Tax=Cokeromyces recurvatus TaxID=90255 RepID=UPI00221E4203|nr:uncharacterized protein BX663DRAFT_507361 [Cokeromyces recurvatus]KAI7903717.1 hypothetical protein BX663DRAFT_507361 [Cokeromyces recurvatus]
MPRQTRRSAPVKQQTRQAHTMPVRQAPPPTSTASKPATTPTSTPTSQQHAMTPSAPPATPAAPSYAQAAPQQPGLFAQMATTAAGVAVGSAVGHTLANGVSSIFSGGSSSEPVAEQPQQTFAPAQPANVSGNACEADAKAFTNCLETSNNDISACQWYLEALKSCQRMAANY